MAAIIAKPAKLIQNILKSLLNKFNLNEFNRLVNNNML